MAWQRKVDMGAGGVMCHGGGDPSLEGGIPAWCHSLGLVAQEAVASVELNHPWSLALAWRSKQGHREFGTGKHRCALSLLAMTIVNTCSSAKFKSAPAQQSCGGACWWAITYLTAGQP